MVGIIILIVIIVLVILYLTGLDFELGTGFTEEKNKAREGDYSIVDKKKIKAETDNEIKLLK